MVIEPRLDENTVVRLELEVLGHIVDNDRLRQVSTDATQILDENRPVRQGVLSVQPILDALRLVYLVQHPVGVILHGGREDNDLIDLGHFREELIAARPDEEGALAADFKVMDERLIQIQHKAVFSTAIDIR